MQSELSQGYLPKFQLAFDSYFYISFPLLRYKKCCFWMTSTCLKNSFCWFVKNSVLTQKMGRISGHPCSLEFESEFYELNKMLSFSFAIESRNIRKKRQWPSLSNEVSRRGAKRSGKVIESCWVNGEEIYRKGIIILIILLLHRHGDVEHILC